MFPMINKKATGINLRRLMDQRHLSVKELQQYLQLGSVQSVYHWLNGICLPSVDNLYALSQLLQVPVDDILCGNRYMITDTLSLYDNRLYIYYMKLSKFCMA